MDGVYSRWSACGCGICRRWIEVCGALCCAVLRSCESSEDSAVTCTHAIEAPCHPSKNSFGSSLCLSQNVALNAVLKHAVPTRMCVSLGCSCKGVMSTTCVVSCCYLLVKLYHALCTLLVAIVPHTVHAYPHSPTRGSSGVCSPIEPIAGVGVCMYVRMS